MQNLEIKNISKKKRVLEELFKVCNNKNNFEFHNDLVKEICKEQGFGNPFDVTKLDNSLLLPQTLIDEDFAVIHLGSGRHQFIKGIDKVYHKFETNSNKIDWNYRKSLLNHFNSSESNILSVANNQRILHHFLFGVDKEFDNIDISERPKTYFPHRTKTSLEYNFGNDNKINLNNIQIEIDLTIEFNGDIGIFEGKNGNPSNFSVYQLYHPFLYYYNAKKELKDKILNIYCVFVAKQKANKGDNGITLNLWAYTFKDPLDITSIQLYKSSSYTLINES